MAAPAAAPAADRNPSILRLCPVLRPALSTCFTGRPLREVTFHSSKSLMIVRLSLVTSALAFAILAAPVQAAGSVGQTASSAARKTGHAVAETGREVGHASAEAGRAVGHATAEAGRQVGHASAEAGRQIGHATAEAGREVGHAAAEAGRKTGQAVKKETKKVKPASPAS
jgi:hypothetical protein